MANSRSSLILLLLAAWCATTAHAQSVDGGTASLTIGHYDVQLEPDLESQSITGTAVLTIIPAHDGVETITLNRGNLDIDTVSENGAAREFAAAGNQLVIMMPRVPS